MVWVELYNTMPAAGTGTNVQPQDSYRVPLWMMPNSAPGSQGYSPYRISIAEFTMERANPPVNTGVLGPPQGLGDPAGPFAPLLPDDGANVLDKAYIGQPWTQCPTSTTDLDFSPIGIPNGAGLIGGGTQAPDPVTGVTAGVDPSQFFLLGPGAGSPSSGDWTVANNVKIFAYYPNPFLAAINGNPGVPANTPVVATNSTSYTPNWKKANNYDERTNGVTVMLRRLANPYLPPQLNPGLPNYNPYVTVDYIPSVPLQTAASTSITSYGKRQPYAGLLAPGTPTRNTITLGKPPLPNGITVANYTYTPNPQYPGQVAQQVGGGAFTIQADNASIIGNTGVKSQGTVTTTFGMKNSPLPASGHYDWLVHLDRPPISPMELLHVSAWSPYKLTQQFMLWGPDTQATIPPPGGGTPVSNTFAHYAPWFDGLPYIFPGTTPNSLSNLACPWWFDPYVSGGPGSTPPPSSHRLYRLFEFLECGDRGFGVNGLGRIPGKVNINTVWDAEILQALIDANTSMGIAGSSPGSAGYPLNTASDPVAQIFSNMMLSRSPSYYNQGLYNNPVSIGPVNMGTQTAGVGMDDRPFLPLSTGLYLPAVPGVPAQFPNGISVTTDTILRTNNPFGNQSSAGNMLAYPLPQAAATPTPSYLLFQNYNDAAGGGVTNSTVHPYYQTQLLTKLYNNVTTRSNTFAVFVTVGFFQVLTDPATGAVLPAVGQTPIPNMPYIPQLGPEIGRTEGKQIRHRMFAIVDRTNLATFTTTSLTPVTGPVATAPPNFTGATTVHLPITVTTLPTTPPQLVVINPTTGTLGAIQVGSQLVIDAGNPNEETVTVTAINTPGAVGLPNFTANFTLPHALGFTITQRGNPGPWLTPYNPRLDSSVVQYFSIID